jgi:hypothetical protein
LSILLSILLFLSPAHAEGTNYPGDFTFLGEGQPAPFEGTLLSVEATATILSMSEYYEAQCNLQTQYQLDRLGAEFQLERNNFEIRLDSLKEEYDLVITQKDLEIAQLQDSLKSQSPRNNWPWFVGGIATGVAVTYGAYRLFGE